MAALRDGGDPQSLRARTVIVRFSDHGELGAVHRRTLLVCDQQQEAGGRRLRSPAGAVTRRSPRASGA